MELILTTAGLFLAAIGLFLNYWQLRQNTKAMQIKILTETYKDLSNLADRIFEVEDRKTETNIKNWDSQLFNRIELFAFLVNRGQLNMDLVEFFRDAIIKYYKDILEKYYANEEEMKNEKIYEEFKKLYKKIKE